MATLSPNFLDELRSRTPLQALVGRNVRLTRSGREFKGCCPFHGEKTPSFYVYDDHFHCFGCGEHGDAITFVMKTRGASFMEAVESLSAEAGLDVPKITKQEAETETKRASLIEVLEAAASIFREWLFLPEGARALSYLRSRELSDATIEKFALGWSGEGRGKLAKSLSKQGITTDQLVQSGLMKLGEFGPVDNFFNRVMFPIWDKRGKIISFGGRVIGDGQPKYINGPETALFSKGMSLYGLNFAREEVRKTGTENTLLLVEGYMDVIALAQAGFPAAVAPLGTAVTDKQLAELWKLSPIPHICFDSDKAGRSAAMRTVELAYPHLAPDRSLKMVTLPEGQDPDSFLRSKGRRAFEVAISAADPLSAVVYRLLAQNANLTTDEGKALFRKKLKEAASNIADRELASEIRKALFDRYFTPGKRAGASKATAPRPPVVASATDDLRARILTSILVSFPREMPLVEESLVHFIRPTPYDDVLDHIENCIRASPNADKAQLRAYLAERELEEVFDEIISFLPSVLAKNASPADIHACWWELFNLMPAPLEALRKQKADLEVVCRIGGSPIDWQRYTKMCQLVWRAEHVMEAEDV